MMIRIEHPDFVSRRLKVEAAGWWRAPRLYQRGVPVPASRGVYLVTTDAGETAPIRMRWDFIDPVPRLRLGQRTLTLARPLRWYEYLWLGLPLLLALECGALGALVGAFAKPCNGQIFRRQTQPWRRYLFTALLGIAAVAICTFLVLLLRLLLHRWSHNAWLLGG